MTHQDWTRALVEELRSKLAAVEGGETVGTCLLEVEPEGERAWAEHWLGCCARIEQEHRELLIVATTPADRLVVDQAFGRRKWGTTMAMRIADRAASVLDGEVTTC